MIQPGLERIARLLADIPLTWRAIHVSGTNGKGSVCKYISSMLDVYSKHRYYQHTGHRDLKWGRFTSPHIVKYWDGIVINGSTLSHTAFDTLMSQLQEKSHAERIEASEFELLTACAFKAFTEHNVDIGIVEVGMGGTLDATNIIGQAQSGHEEAHRARPLVTAITKIGLDHQAFLGDSLVEIATHKAGIMKTAVPVVYDQSNEAEVKALFDKCAKRVEVDSTSFAQLASIAGMLDWTYLPAEESPAGLDIEKIKPAASSSHLEQNNSVALRSTLLALEQLGRLKPKDPDATTALSELLQEMSVVAAAASSQLPGRLEKLVLHDSFGGVGTESANLLVDGAHNAQSSAVLANEVDRLRKEQMAEQHNDRMTWVLAASAGRDLDQLLKPLLRSGDSVVAVEFGPVEGMPWVKPVPAQEILATAERLMHHKCGHMLDCGTDVQAALLRGAEIGRPGLTIVAGSLYLVGQVHEVLKNRTSSSTG